MKKLVVTLVVAGALLFSMAPAFAAQTVTSPALPGPNVAEKGGVFSEIWFSQGVFVGD